GGQYLAEEFHFARTQCAATSKITLPAQVETYQLPHGIQAQAAGHDRIAFEMACEEPEFRIDIQLGNQLAFAIFATDFADVSDAIDHQHVRCGQLRVTWAEQL